MKKSSIFIIIFSALLAIFLSCFIGFSIGKDYAANHYEVNRGEKDYGIITHYEFGCGENDCKYCNGRKVSDSSPYWSESLAEQFVYYRTLNTFKVVSLVTTITAATCLTVTIGIKYKESIKRIFRKK